jgi:hypothetical protein
MNNKQIKMNLLTIMQDKVKLQPKQGNLKEWRYSDYKTGEQLIEAVNQHIKESPDTSFMADALIEGYSEILNRVFEFLPTERDLVTAVIKDIEGIQTLLSNISHFVAHENFKGQVLEFDQKKTVSNKFSNIQAMVNELGKDLNIKLFF